MTTKVDKPIGIIKYDKFNRPLRKRLKSGQVIRYVYEKETDEDTDQSLYMTTYDSKGNVIAQETQDGEVVRYKFDKNNNCIDICYGNEMYPAIFSS